MQPLRSAENGIGNQATIEGYQLAPVGYGQCKQITIGDLFGCCDSADLKPLSIQNAHVVGPKYMPG